MPKLIIIEFLCLRSRGKDEWGNQKKSISNTMGKYYKLAVFFYDRVSIIEDPLRFVSRQLKFPHCAFLLFVHISL